MDEDKHQTEGIHVWKCAPDAKRPLILQYILTVELYL